jgi:hypothetical protein
MTERKRSQKPLTDMSVGQALARLMQTKPKELAESIASDVVKGRDRAKKRIQDARKEIEDGARPKKGRFRL